MGRVVTRISNQLGEKVLDRRGMMFWAKSMEGKPVTRNGTVVGEVVEARVDHDELVVIMDTSIKIHDPENLKVSIGGR